MLCLCTYKVIILEYTQTGVLLSSWLHCKNYWINFRFRLSQLHHVTKEMQIGFLEISLRCFFFLLLYQKTYLTAFQASLPQPSNRCVRSKQQTQNLTRNADWYINWINKNKHNSDLNPMHFLNFMCHAHTRFATEAIKVTETFLQCMW